VEDARRRLAQSLGWAITVAVAYALLGIGRVEPRDPDSSLYVAIARSLESRPAAQWNAPRWPEGRARSGLFREHPAVFFWPAAALGRLGLGRAALLCNLFWYLALLGTLVALGRALLGNRSGWLAGALFLVSPLGLQYLLRFNHEVAWGFATLAGLLCLVGPRLGPGRGLALVGWLVLACAMKGALGLLALPLWAAWAWRRGLLRPFASWAVLGVAAVALLAALYELAYRRTTGEGFLAVYFQIQHGYVEQAEQIGWGRKLFTPLYYLLSAAYFVLPSSLLLGWDALRSRRGVRAEARWLPLVCGSGWMVLLSMTSRRAIRYAFPVLPLFHLAGAEAIAHGWPRASAWLERRRPLAPFLAMAWILTVIAVRAFLEPGWYRFINPL
jgi:4-amino-4-deoxy-L-arabinose transferase-like glycosyltransferase